MCNEFMRNNMAKSAKPLAIAAVIPISYELTAEKTDYRLLVQDTTNNIETERINYLLFSEEGHYTVTIAQIGAQGGLGPVGPSPIEDGILSTEQVITTGTRDYVYKDPVTGADELNVMTGFGHQNDMVFKGDGITSKSLASLVAAPIING